MIWTGGQNPRTVRVGQGDIKTRLLQHRQDTKILAYQGLGLFVTWAFAPAADIRTVARALLERRRLSAEEIDDLID